MSLALNPLDDMKQRQNFLRMPLPSSVSSPVSLPDAAAPSLAVTLPSVQAPRGTIAGDVAERGRLLNTGPGESQIYNKVTQSGFGRSHPIAGKILGGLGQGLATIGDAALSSVAPSLAINLPGTAYHHQMLLNHLNRQIGAEEGEKEKEAQTAEMEARVPFEQAQTENLKHPNLTALPTATGYESYNPKTGVAAPIQAEGGKPLMPYVKPGPLEKVTLMGPDGKPMLGFTRDGVTWDSQGKVVENPVPFEKEPSAPRSTVMIKGKPYVVQQLPGGHWQDKDGNYDVVGEAPPNYAMIAPELKTFQTKDENGQNVTKTLSGRTLGALPDTTTQRNMAEMAATVQPQMESVIGEVNDLANAIGPAVGRWNQLLTNKGGADFPEFAGLDTDLDLLASAIVRTHFGARGGQEYRQELRKMFGEAQSPQDLVNRIQHAESWIEGYAASGGVKTPKGHAYQGPSGGTQEFTDGGVTYRIPKDQVEAFKKDHPNAR